MLCAVGVGSMLMLLLVRSRFEGVGRRKAATVTVVHFSGAFGSMPI